MSSQDSAHPRHLAHRGSLRQTVTMGLPDAPHAGATPPAPIVTVLLAAGAGSRFRDEGHKLDATLPADPASTSGSNATTTTVLGRALAHAMAAGIGPVVVVTGAVDPALPPGVIRCHNPEWASGQMSSLRAGIGAADRLGAAAVVVGLADQPGIQASAWRRVAAADGPIAVATYDGRRGNPVKLERAVWDLLPDAGDEGGRALMRVRPDLVREVPCTGSPADIDTVEDLRRWQTS